MMQAGVGIYVSDSGTWRIPYLTPITVGGGPSEPARHTVRPRKRRGRQAAANRTVAGAFLSSPILHAPALGQMTLETRLALAAAVQRVFLPDFLGAA